MVTGSWVAIGLRTLHLGVCASWSTALHIMRNSATCQGATLRTKRGSAGCAKRGVRVVVQAVVRREEGGCGEGAHLASQHASVPHLARKC